MPPNMYGKSQGCKEAGCPNPRKPFGRRDEHRKAGEFMELSKKQIDWWLIGAFNR